MARLYPPVSDRDQHTGNPNAPIILVEYGDYQCPHCGKAYPLIKRLLAEEGDHFLFAYRHFPLQESHPSAYPAALAAEAAGKQNKFWEMHSLIFEHQEQLNPNLLLDLAASLELDLRQFAADWKDQAIHRKVEGDFGSGLRSGVNGTPTFFVNNERIVFDESYSSLLHAVTMV